ncbi:hypothetical protein A6D6_01329 [Alcanivorax xiamenensis]|uniref:Uncharacterized protein n=1 Tax=Alcanivorax xiamenensis TaxID=1177156 RepID=A0ABQ6YA01_9GAMM|nr:hypothetical protein [Alcanivorax xiamenensis]KAF0806654.1 hypothetical protein A6D6_01329 [Alcanivorax xiamenensis]
MTTKTYVAFPSSDDLHQTTDGFIRRMARGARSAEPETVEKIMRTFVEEALEVFFLKPAAMAGLGSGQMRLIRVACDTIAKATGLVVGRSARKMDLAQSQAAARYMDDIRFQSNNGDIWYVAFPIDEVLAEKGRQARRLADEGRETEARDALIAYLREMTEVALDWYFEKPVALLHFGPILRKVAAVGIDTTRRASFGVIGKVIPKLERQQLLHSVHYYCGMQRTF